MCRRRQAAGVSQPVCRRRCAAAGREAAALQRPSASLHPGATRHPFTWPWAAMGPGGYSLPACQPPSLPASLPAILPPSLSFPPAGSYTTGPSPVRTADFPPVRTPEALLLYGLPVFSLFVHQKPFSCTELAGRLLPSRDLPLRSIPALRATHSHGHGRPWVLEGTAYLPASLPPYQPPCLPSCLPPSPSLQPVRTPQGLLLYELPIFPRFVHQRPFSCTDCRFSPCLYTRSPSPVRTADFPPVCTPEALLLYELTANTLRIMGREYPLRIESV